MTLTGISKPDNRPGPPRRGHVPPDRLVSIGGPVREYRPERRLLSDDSDPESVLRALGVAATKSWRTGDPLSDRYGCHAHTGARFFDVRHEPHDGIWIDAALSSLLDAVSASSDMWRDLMTRYQVDVFCGLFSSNGTGHEGFSLPASLVKRLAERGLSIGFDIYDDPRSPPQADFGDTADHDA